MKEKTNKVAIKPVTKTKYPLNAINPFIYAFNRSDTIPYDKLPPDHPAKYEYWAPITNQAALGIYPTYYYISNLGRVFNFMGQEMKQYPDTGGYPVVTLCTSEGPKLFRVHRLVMLTFRYNELYLNYTVDHINANKMDNYIDKVVYNSSTGKYELKDNLRWATKADNYLVSFTDEQRYFSENFYTDMQGNIKKYDIPRKFNGRLSDEVVNRICELIDDGYTINNIAQITNTTSSNVKNIKYGYTHRNISQNYNFINNITSNKPIDSLEDQS